MSCACVSFVCACAVHVYFPASSHEHTYLFSFTCLDVSVRACVRACVRPCMCDPTQDAGEKS